MKRNALLAAVGLLAILMLAVAFLSSGKVSGPRPVTEAAPSPGVPSAPSAAREARSAAAPAAPSAPAVAAPGPAEPAGADRPLSPETRVALQQRDEAVRRLQFEQMPAIDGCLAAVASGARRPVTLRVSFKQDPGEPRRFVVDGLDPIGPDAALPPAFERCLSQLHTQAIEVDPLAAAQPTFSQLVTLLLPAPGAPRQGPPSPSPSPERSSP